LSRRRRRGEETRRGEERRRGGEEDEEEEDEEDEEEATDIKSNNPHLAGGEKHEKPMGNTTVLDSILEFQVWFQYGFSFLFSFAAGSVNMCTSSSWPCCLQMRTRHHDSLFDIK